MVNIKIIQKDGGAIAFLQDWPGATENDPVEVNRGDIVTWNNRTDGLLELVSQPPGTFITKPIPAGQASSPGFLANGSLTYSCVAPSVPEHRIIVTQ